MKVSGFTFIRNGVELGYPFLLSIQSALPLCDEFIIAVGESNDATLAAISELKSSKIKIIETKWNPHMHGSFVLSEQKMIAHYACTGDWALYIEGDEVIHEQDIPSIQQAMKQHLHNDNIEALVFDYLHFYGNIKTTISSPSWCRRAPRILKRSVKAYAPDALFWTVRTSNKKSRYPKAALANATIYHYGHVRSIDEMLLKGKQMSVVGWDLGINAATFNYSNIDYKTLKEFNSSHPEGITSIFPSASKKLQANKNHTLTKREKKNRLGLLLEKIFNIDLSNKRFKLMKTD